MVKCSFCHHVNEDGALFCEQCKSELGAVAVESAAAPAQPEGFSHFEPHSGEAVPVAAALDEQARLAETMPAEENPFAFLETPYTATPVEPAIPAVPPMASPAAGAEPPPAAVPAAKGPVAAAVRPGSLPAAESIRPSASPAVAPSPTAPAAVAHVQTALSAPPGPPPPLDADRLPSGACPKLVVLRGLKINVEFPLYEGHNFIGRADEKPVDVDLEDQEPPERIWSSRQHAVITYEDDKLIIEDLNSSNGTFVNRNRVHPGQKRALRVNDVIQIGTVQMKVKL
jgi:hypothetical protein